MTDAEFDRAVVAAAFDLAGREGWSRLSVAAAARDSGLDLQRARPRFPSRSAVLLRFGVIADQAALAEATVEGPVRDRLFGMIMRRIDVMQAHREGMLALLRHLPSDPPVALLLAMLSRRSMGWLLEGAGIGTGGVRGGLRARGLLGVWLWTVRAWQRDDSEDLSATMAALDRALDRADRAAQFLGGGSGRVAPPADAPEVSDAPRRLETTPSKPIVSEPP